MRGDAVKPGEVVLRRSDGRAGVVMTVQGDRYRVLWAGRKTVASVTARDVVPGMRQGTLFPYGGVVGGDGR